MRKPLMMLSMLSLLLTLLPSFLVFLQIISLDTNKNLMLAGTLGWFLTAPFWMNKKKKEDSGQA